MAKKDFSKWLLLNSSSQAICDHDGIVDVSISEKSQVLTEPIENGQLAAFNKTQAPTAVTVSIAIKGDGARQTASLAQLQALKTATGDSALCSLITPSGDFSRLALESIGYARSASQNASLLVVQLSFVTIRAVAATSGTIQWAPKSASSASESEKGRVQPSALSKL